MFDRMQAKAARDAGDTAAISAILGGIGSATGNIAKISGGGGGGSTAAPATL